MVSCFVVQQQHIVFVVVVVLRKKKAKKKKKKKSQRKHFKGRGGKCVSQPELERRRRAPGRHSRRRVRPRCRRSCRSLSEAGGAGRVCARARAPPLRARRRCSPGSPASRPSPSPRVLCCQCGRRSWKSFHLLPRPPGSLSPSPSLGASASCSGPRLSPGASELQKSLGGGEVKKIKKKLKSMRWKPLL